MQEANLDIKIGIGINSGDAVIGNMASETRFDYTAKRDAATSARQSNKEVEKDIVIAKILQ